MHLQHTAVQTPKFFSGVYVRRFPHARLRLLLLNYLQQRDYFILKYEQCRIVTGSLVMTGGEIRDIPRLSNKTGTQ
jgi:hypothetical protein